MDIKSKKKRGFTLVELLIALAVLGMILAAVAAAFDAAAVSYRQNTGMYETMTAGRQALSRMTTLIRTGQVSPASEGATECSLITAANEDITFSFNQERRELLLVKNNNGGSFILCSNVDQLEFAKTLGGPTDGRYVTSVVITMTLTVDGVSQTLSSAAVLRKNL